MQTVVIGGRASDNIDDENWSNPTVYTTGGKNNQVLSSSPYTDISKIENSQGQNVNYIIGNNAQGLENLGVTLGQGFEGLFDLIQQTTQANNAWSAEQAQKQMDFQREQNDIAMNFNAQEAAKNRDWQMMMSNSAHQREIADLKAAGLNPVLSASGGNGAAVTSGATASGVTSAGAKGDTDTSMNQAIVSLYGALLNSQTSMYNANLSAQTNLKMAEMQMNASMYAAQLAAQTARSGNVIQLVNDTLGDNPITNTGKKINDIKVAYREGQKIAETPLFNTPMSVEDSNKVINDMNVFQRLGAIKRGFNR